MDKRTIIVAEIMAPTELTKWIENLREMFLIDPEFRPKNITGPFGTHGCTYNTDEDGCRFVTVGFVMPDRVFAEIEDGTYGELQGLRIYTNPEDQLEPRLE